MSELFTNLGINGPALLAHGVNFLVVLVVLYFALYKPLLALVAEREQTISKGLLDAKHAERNLSDSEKQKALKIAEAEGEALRMIQKAEEEARTEGEKVRTLMQAKADGIVEEAKLIALRERKEVMDDVEEEAATFVRALFEKTVSLSPSLVDEALIAEAMRELGKK
ncbi:MAG: ATP synthase F0 subunit B [Patescibacteria group bacterium]